MADPNDKRRVSQAYLPPPPASGDDAPGSVHFPRMSPPPASLEALMRNGPRAALLRERGITWAWVALLLVIVAGVAYYVGSRP